MRQVLANPARGFDKVHRVVIVLVDPRCDGENIRVENNVFGRKANLFGEDLVSAGTDFDLARFGIRLALFIERHHNHGCSVAAHQFGLLDEFVLAFFHGNRVDNAFTLDALQTRFDDFPFR